MATPYKLSFIEIETGLDISSTFKHSGDFVANRIIKYLATSDDILLGDGTTASLSGFVPVSRHLTINGTSYDLSDSRSWSVGTVTSISELTLGTTGTDLNSTVANGTTTPVITLNVPTASSTNRGVLSPSDWIAFNTKQNALNGLGFVKANGTTISYDNSTYLTTISGITAGGELSGTYPNPTVLNSAVTGKVLTGVNITGGTVLATDSILTAFGKLQNQINGLVGGSIYQGTWNASTNVPTLSSSVGTKGHYYVVNVDGSTNLNGITDWKVGDWVIYNGAEWQKVDNTDAVSSVNGFTGAVSLTTSNVTEGTSLYFTNARVIASTLTGYTSGAGTISASDTILSAIQKLNGNIGAVSSSLSGYVPASRTLTINDTTFDLSANRSWTIPTHDAVTLGTPNGLSLSGQVLSLGLASSINAGALSAADWSAFNAKQPAGNYVTLDTVQTITAPKTFQISSGSNIPLTILKGGNGEGLIVNKTSGSGNAVTVIGDFEATVIKKTGGTANQVLLADGTVTEGLISSGEVYNKFVQNAFGNFTTGFIPKITNDGVSTYIIGNSQIQDNGTNVSIGYTTNPSLYKLDVNGTGRFTNDLSIISASSTSLFINNTSASGKNYRLISKDDGNFVIQRTGIADLLTIASTGAATFSSSVTATNLYSTGGSNFATSGGNVGIGTASPAFRFNVNSGGTSGNSFSAAFSDNTTNQNAIAFSHFDNNSRIYATFLAGAGSDQSLSFWTTLSNSAQFERLRITSTGNVLIGTTTDAGYKLDVNGVINGSGNAYFGGNVGIGTASPSAKLDVNETSAGVITNSITLTNASNTINTEAGLFFAPTVATGNIRGARITGFQEDGNNAIGLKFYTGTGATITEKMRITSGGNVGINTTSPTAKLDVNGTMNVTGSATFSTTLKTGNPTGGTAQPFKVGSVYSTSSVFAGDVLQVEINGVSYDLMIANSAT